MSLTIPAVILAGGLGTRLRAVVPDLPKPMAEVAGQPFLWWVLRRLEQQGLTDVYLAIGYRGELIRQYFGERFGALHLHYVVEGRPLGTGGAIALAMAAISGDQAFILNGDTMAIVDLAALARRGAEPDVDLAMAVAEVPDTARYGAIDFEPRSHRVTAFREKGCQGPGFINAGVYLLKRAPFAARLPGERFSFEQDYLHARLAELQVAALPEVTGLIDIGVPDDYALAQTRVLELISRDAG
ncbi:MAG: nucleotidyltransferase family protein [Paraburkholderia tropica]|uniref:nucleotidyltransferase family protein n=1 Tax=Burkholderia gladioli TaxID=28095 RepID=UPI00050EAE4B|nr:nucleotidyltransferase family protein [Burkholderia gladioli]AYQ87471.1 nucleotidyl transferase [Burkholderia gladioli]KGE07306.1 nucleotidyl transferase [Burkholderia gladioli]